MLDATPRSSAALGATAVLELTYGWDGIGEWQA